MKNLIVKIRDFWKRDAERARPWYGGYSSTPEFMSFRIPPIHRIWTMVKRVTITMLLLSPIIVLGIWNNDFQYGDAEKWSSYEEIWVSTYLGYHVDGAYCFASVRRPETWTGYGDIEMIMSTEQKETLKIGGKVSFSQKQVDRDFAYFVLSEQEVKALVAKGLKVTNLN